MTLQQTPAAVSAPDPSTVLESAPHGPTREIVEFAIAAIDDAAAVGAGPIYNSDFRALKAILYWTRRAVSCRECAVDARLEGFIADAGNLETSADRYLSNAAACAAGTADPGVLRQGWQA